MQPIELRARREALGLSQADLGGLFEPPVKQSVISMWESGNRSPRNAMSLHLRLCDLEEILLELIERTVERLVHASAVRDSREVEAVTYATDEDYWAADAEARGIRLPAALHRVATAAAVAEVREEHDLDVAIVER